MPMIFLDEAFSASLYLHILNIYLELHHNLSIAFSSSRLYSIEKLLEPQSISFIDPQFIFISGKTISKFVAW